MKNGDALAEVKRCRDDFEYFAGRWLKIIDMRGKERKLHLKPVQKKLISMCEKHSDVCVLKGRKMGSSTVISAWFTWMANFRPNTRVLVLAHTDRSARNIFKIYKRFFKSLPREMTHPIVQSNLEEILLENGSWLRVVSASSESARGTDADLIHGSEFPQWGQLGEAIAANFNTGGNHARIVMEGTANGLNEAYDFWHDNNGWQKLFLCWKDDPEYATRRAYFDDINEDERLYKERFELDDDQFNWMVRMKRKNCGNSWHIFNQEYPATPELAFVTSGSRWLPDTFSVGGRVEEGVKIFAEPAPYRVYSMGVDTASGSPGGDFSAFSILDVTPHTKLEEGQGLGPGDIKAVATYYAHISPSDFRRVVSEYAKKYGAMVVVETNYSWANVIFEELKAAGHEFLYTRMQQDRVTKKWSRKLGFNTGQSSRNELLNRLYEHITRKWMRVECPRMMKECNSMIYDARGRIAAESGKHDDMVVAHGLALMGMDQVAELAIEPSKSRRPESIAEKIAWELASGKAYGQTPDQDFADPPEWMMNRVSLSDLL
jgi:hypothetical protein